MRSRLPAVLRLLVLVAAAPVGCALLGYEFDERPEHSGDAGPLPEGDAGPLPEGDAGLTVPPSTLDGSARDADAARADCAPLEACCRSLNQALAPQCEEFVRSSPVCDVVLSSYVRSGYCTGDQSCTTLAPCCPTMPTPDTTEGCQRAVGSGIGGQCSSVLTAYQKAGYCNGHPGGLSDRCYALSSCCPNLAGPARTRCEQDVASNQDIPCGLTLAPLAADGGPCR